MEYISAEEFLKQPKEVQKSFLEWWQPEMRDLFFRDFRKENDNKQFLRGIYIGCILDNGTKINAKRSKESKIEYAPFSPLFTEGQLRKFIEDKTKEVTYTGATCGGDRLVETENENFTAVRREQIMDKDLLMAYWKYACRLIKEGLYD